MDRSKQRHGHLWPKVKVDPQDQSLLDGYAWSIHSKGRTWHVVGADWVNGRRVGRHLHRMIMNAPPGVEVDHVNGDGLDNRRCNLRFATKVEQSRKRNPVIGSTSKFKGVSWVPRVKKWHAQIAINGKKKHLGYFHNEKDAASAYDAAAKALFGEYARLNFPEE